MCADDSARDAVRKLPRFARRCAVGHRWGVGFRDSGSRVPRSRISAAFRIRDALEPESCVKRLTRRVQAYL
jgi:hypothetical protein